MSIKMSRHVTCIITYFLICTYDNHKLNYISHHEYVGNSFVFQSIIYIHTWIYMNYIYYAYFPNLNAEVCVGYYWLRYDDIKNNV